MPSAILLKSLQDILEVESDDDFEKILLELPADLRSMREIAKQPGHGGFMWPIKWRSAGGPSTVTTHCTDGVAPKRPMRL